MTSERTTKTRTRSKLHAQTRRTT